MDDKKCVRSPFAYMPSPGIRLDSFTDSKYISKKLKQRSSQDRKCRGDILYVQNPLFKNVAIRLKDNTKGCEVVQINCEENNSRNINYYHRLFSADHIIHNSKIPNDNNNKKSRRDGMKARAETRRRDVLTDESSDEYYSSINSSSDLKPPINSRKSSSNMDDAYNRRSRSARTERYFRRLSRDDNFHDYDSSAANFRISEPRRVQNVKFPLGTYENQQFSHPGRNNQGDRSPNSMFFGQDDGFLNNPIYRTSKADPGISCNKESRKEMTENRAHSANIDYNKTRRSDPGSSAILAYKNNKSPRALDRVQYIEPQIFNYQQSHQTFQQSKPSIDPRRYVWRSRSFQNEIPKEYETGNNGSSPIRRTPIAQVSKSRNNHLRNERKGIDSITSPVLPPPDPSPGDSQRRKLYRPKEERAELIAGLKNDPSSKIISAIIQEDKIPAQKRSSKDLGKELSELEKMYTSLRLSDDNLLERAEERCVEEFNLKGQLQASKNELSKKYLSSSSSSESILEDGLKRTGEKYPQQSSEAHVINDDMAYRKMQTKKMPALSETQNSLSQISYLLSSSGLILGESEQPDNTPKLSKEEPNITKDDMVYRNLHYANNVLRVIEPQPPFGIPLRPATPSTNSNYLCSSPVALKSPPLKYVPESEPNLVTDDLAFRNLRKDAPRTPPILSDDNKQEVNAFSFKIEFEKPLEEEKFFKKKKKAVRSLSANLYGLIKEVKDLDFDFK